VKALFAAIMLAGAAHAQQPVVPNFLSASEVRAAIAKAAQAIKPGQPTYSAPLIAANGYTARLEYRRAVGPAAIHEGDAEIFYVLDGGGTYVTGGGLVEGTPRPGGNLSGKSIDGGVSRHVGVGDFFVVPAGAPHFFSTIDGKLVLIALHVPAGAPPKP
jgi:mannose-6-phosphate isomerase-like protein (cupin superfamily)